MPTTITTEPCYCRRCLIHDDPAGCLVAFPPVEDDVDDEEPYYEMCECEQDWNCGLHGGTTRPTWIETRYDYSDEPAWAR